MPEIKTKEFINAKEAFDTVSDLGDRMRRGLAKSTDRAKTLTEDGQGLHILLVGNIGKINEFLVEPFSIQLHTCYLLRTGSGTGYRCRRSDAGH